jgi:hypothetical protein
MRQPTTFLGRLSLRPRASRLAAAAVASLIGALTLSSMPAAAQAPQCANRDAVLERLSAQYHEEPISIGVTATGSLLEVLASPEGSWTIIITAPGGPTCLVSSGEGWRGAPVQVAEEPGV